MANSSLNRIRDFLRSVRRVLVSGHVRSDADALGSQLAFARALRKLRKTAHVVCDHGVLPELRFLPGTHQVGRGPADLRPPYDAVVTFDSGAWSRLERIAHALPRPEIFVVNVDHHASNDRFGDLNWVDDRYSSSAEMAWELIRSLGVKPDRQIATCIYTGIVTDTGRFSFSNTSAETHRRAAELLELGIRPAEIYRALYRQKTPSHLRFLSECIARIRTSGDGRVAWVSLPRDMQERAGFEIGDTQEYVDLVKSLRGVRVALLFRELDGRVKISFRTEGVDGIALAAPWGGGGHRRASGATVEGPLARVEPAVIRRTLTMVKRGGR